MLLSKVDGTGNKGVLRRAIDERNLVKNTSDGKYSGWSDLIVTSFDGIKEVVGSVINTFDNVGVTLSICRPEDDDLVEVVGSLELARNLLVLCQRH